MYYGEYPYADWETAGLPRKTGSLIARELPKDGNRKWKVTTQPTIEPVTLAEQKIFSRIDTTAEDSLIEGFIRSARWGAEEYLGRAFISQTIQSLLDFWPGRIVELPRPPLISITKVVTLDADGNETTYSSDNYYLNTFAEPGQLIIKRDVTSPQNTERDYARYLIESVHGYGTSADDVPQPFKEGIMLWAAVIYATREFDPKNPPPEARSKFDLYRQPRVIFR